jgi:O-antigen biosynthesis protein
MKRFWTSLVLPILDVLQPETIIEVGSLEGETTELLLKFCQDHGGTVHGIDPLPRFDVAAWQAEYGDRFQFHRAKSLEVLRDLPAADLVFIDGDHNWYTVYHELKQLAEAAARHDRPYPVVLFHDIGWPYARRDLYYDPTDIPPEFRQPYEQKGIWPGRGALEEHAFNANLHNATLEGGPRNGVLTAVEDFMAENDEPMRLILIDGFFGLGIMYPASLVDYAPAPGRHLSNLALSVSMLGEHLSNMNDRLNLNTARQRRERLQREPAKETHI